MKLTSSYPKSASEIILVGCWAPARRKIYEAKEESLQAAYWLLGQIGHLYRIETELRKTKSGGALREARRASYSKMIVNRLEKVLRKKQPGYLPQSQMGKALGDALGQ